MASAFPDTLASTDWLERRRSGRSPKDGRRQSQKFVANARSPRMSGDPPAVVPISVGVEYELFASDDMSVTVLSFKPDRQVARLRDDDAARLRADHATIIAQFPNWTADQILARLWDQGGYSWLATDGG